jgi:hypothetical protein
MGNCRLAIPLAAQLLWAGSCIWLAFHDFMPSHPVFLVAHPQPIRYYDTGDVFFQFYEGDTEKLATIEETRSKILLSGPINGVIYASMRDREKLANFYRSDTVIGSILTLLVRTTRGGP